MSNTTKSYPVTIGNGGGSSSAAGGCSASSVGGAGAGCTIISVWGAGGGGGLGGQGLHSGGIGKAPTWWSSGSPTVVPTVTLKKYVGMGEGTDRTLEKIESKKWKVINFTFRELISLQEHGIKYTWLQEDDNVYVTFESEADESQAIMLIGSIPYDKD